MGLADSSRAVEPTAAAAGGPPAAARPDVVKAIPVRHWGRWLGAGIVIYLIVALLVSFIKNPNTDWSTVWTWLFKSYTLIGLEYTIILTFAAMLVGGIGGTILAIMRLSENYVLSTVSWIYIWFFRGTPVYVQIVLWGNIGVLYSHFVVGLPLTGIAFWSTGAARSSIISSWSPSWPWG